jgi:type IV pilus biogenesis protein CpaD/CtpE
MKKTHFIASSLAVATLLVACSDIPKEAYYKRGQPESLLERSKKEAVFDIASQDDVKRILLFAKQARPSQAAFKCQETSKSCNRLEQALRRNSGVSITRVTSAHNNVTFSFEQIAVRDCENRYIDNMINPYNLNHPTFGCSLAANSAQMVTDKRQFTDPDIMDSSDARKGVQVSDQYYTAPKADTDFAPITSAESLVSGSGGGR